VCVSCFVRISGCKDSTIFSNTKKVIEIHRIRMAVAARELPTMEPREPSLDALEDVCRCFVVLCSLESKNDMKNDRGCKEERAGEGRRECGPPGAQDVENDEAWTI
jgi:hypothetical protein